MYKISKEQCQSNIDQRMPIVCCGCGGEITPIETVDNADNPTFWMGCIECMCFDNGTTPEIYATATKMVDERNFRAYHYDTQPDKEKEPRDFKYWRDSQIKGTVSFVSDVLHLHRHI